MWWIWYLCCKWSHLVLRSLNGGCSRIVDVSSSSLSANGSTCNSLCAAGVQPKPRGQRAHTETKQLVRHMKRTLLTTFVSCRASRLNASSSCLVSLIRLSTVSVRQRNDPESSALPCACVPFQVFMGTFKEWKSSSTRRKMLSFRWAMLLRLNLVRQHKYSLKCNICCCRALIDRLPVPFL